jgi:hypothetical protein
VVLTLASSLAEVLSALPGSDKTLIREKPLRRECRVFRVPVASPGVPCALSWGETIHAQLGRIARRGADVRLELAHPKFTNQNRLGLFEKLNGGDSSSTNVPHSQPSFAREKAGDPVFRDVSDRSGKLRAVRLRPIARPCHRCAQKRPRCTYELCEGRTPGT